MTFDIIVSALLACCFVLLFLIGWTIIRLMEVNEDE